MKSLTLLPTISGLTIFLYFFFLPLILLGQNNLEQPKSSFLWPSEMRETLRESLFTRSTEKTSLSIPIPGSSPQFYIGPNQFLQFDQSDPLNNYQSFSGHDSLSNPVFGYFYEDQIHLSFYVKGNIMTINPIIGRKDLYHVTSTEDPESMGSIQCDIQEIPQISVRNGGASVNCQSQYYAHHTFDLFAVCTGEWGSYYGSKAAARSGIADQISALNALYTAELNISFNLITDAAYLFTNGSTDEFDPSGFSLADQARNFFKAYVQVPFDIGHVFHYSGPSGGLSASGVAYLGSSCADSYKGGGWTSTNSPNSIGFNIQVFAHEIGHQLGAYHDFYGSQGNCSGAQRSSGHGFEPGSGSTLMSYESQCGSHNLDGPRSSTLYLNTHSVSQILSRINSQSCGFSSGSASNLSIQIPRDFSIPIRTAFDLTATGGNAANSYIWEQYDTDYAAGNSGRSNPLNGGNYSTTPMYRSYVPSGDGNHRSFPSKAVQQSGAIQRGEVYATVARDITMRLMTRSGGNIRCDEMTVTVRNAPQFKILQPLKNDLIALSKAPTRASDKLTVQWETGDTENNGFPTIDIMYSIDGGQSYPYLLADDVPNDGEHDVRPPEIDTDQARLKILLTDGSGQMAIYNENGGNFTVGFSVAPIEIAKFSGVTYDDYHELSWILNNTGEFIKSVNLEYSYDGISFNSVALTGFESLNSESQWVDGYQSFFTKGLKTYYRMAIENTQNEKTFSAVIALKNNEPDQFLQIFPNPINQQEAHLQFRNFLPPEASIIVWSVNGQKMMETHPLPNSKSMSLPFYFPDGLYIVEVINESDAYKQKVIVQNR